MLVNGFLTFAADSSYERRSSHDHHRIDDEDSRFRRPLRAKPISFPVDQGRDREYGIIL